MFNKNIKDEKLRELLFGNWTGDDTMLPVTGGYFEKLGDRIGDIEDKLNYPSIYQPELFKIVLEQDRIIEALLNELGYEFVTEESFLKKKGKEKTVIEKPKKAKKSVK